MARLPYTGGYFNLPAPRGRGAADISPGSLNPGMDAAAIAARFKRDPSLRRSPDTTDSQTPGYSIPAGTPRPIEHGRPPLAHPGYVGDEDEDRFNNYFKDALRMRPTNPHEYPDEGLTRSQHDTGPGRDARTRQTRSPPRRPILTYDRHPADSSGVHHNPPFNHASAGQGNGKDLGGTFIEGVSRQSQTKHRSHTAPNGHRMSQSYHTGPGTSIPADASRHHRAVPKTSKQTYDESSTQRRRDKRSPSRRTTASHNAPTLATEPSHNRVAHLDGDRYRNTRSKERSDRPSKSKKKRDPRGSDNSANTSEMDELL